jgi:hypothetical protein
LYSQRDKENYTAWNTTEKHALRVSFSAKYIIQIRNIFAFL